MGDYLRTTRECTLDNLNPTLATALRTHIAKHALGDVEAAILLCCETTSTKQKKGLFGGKAEVILTGMLLTPQWLIWAAGPANQPPGVLSAKLRNIQVQDYEKSDLHKLVPDTGLNIAGLYTDTPTPGTNFIGLGPEPAAQKFRTMLQEALAKAG